MLFLQEKKSRHPERHLLFGLLEAASHGLEWDIVFFLGWNAAFITAATVLAAIIITTAQETD